MNENEMPSVDILMATYNGELYLSDQINSIIRQTYHNWRLIIRDDGSSDKTSLILSFYSELDKRITVVSDTQGNLGVSKNFFTLLKIASAEFVMFADQDDVWLPDKIEESMRYMLSTDFKNTPVLCFCNSILMNYDLTKILKYNYNFKHQRTLSNFLFWEAGYQGASMLLSRSLVDSILPIFPNCPVHDYHVSLVALLSGHVHFIETPLLLYRRHGYSTTNQNTGFNQRFNALVRGRSKISQSKFTNYLQHVRDSYINSGKDQDAKSAVMNAYFDIVDSKVSIFKKIQLIFKHKFTLRESSYYLIFKLLIAKKR